MSGDLISGIRETAQTGFSTLGKGLRSFRNSSVNGNLDLPNLLRTGQLRPDNKHKVLDGTSTTASGVS